jgi:hypothetical protein
MNRTQAFELIAEELDARTMKRGVWLQAHVEAEGDEDRARRIYAEIRLKELLPTATDDRKLTEQAQVVAETVPASSRTANHEPSTGVRPHTQSGVSAQGDSPVAATVDEPSRALRIAISAALSFLFGMFVAAMENQHSGTAYLAYATGSAFAIGIIPCLLAATFKGWGGLSMAVVAAVGVFALILFGRNL